MNEKDNLTDVVQIVQNKQPDQPKVGTQVVANDGTVVTLENRD